MGVGAFGAASKKEGNILLRYVISVSCPHGGVVLVQGSKYQGSDQH